MKESQLDRQEQVMLLISGGKKKGLCQPGLNLEHQISIVIRNITSC